MAEAIRIGAGSADPASGSYWRRRHQHRNSAPSFQQVLAGVQWRAPVQMHATRVVARVPLAVSPAPPTGTLPAAADAALTQAMKLEDVPASWKAGLSYIMAHESGGQIDARNPTHSARGLYQLTRANWYLNPHGAASFGNPVEEAQGGIRYIRTRYGSIDQAVAFWQQHHWY